MTIFNIPSDFNTSRVCVSCLHNGMRDGKCRCDANGHYITYSENFTSYCKEWIPNKKWKDYYGSEEELDDLILEGEEIKALKDTHFESIPKGVIQFALNQILKLSKDKDGESIRHGQWVSHHEPYTWIGYNYWSCSECNFECGYNREIYRRTKYCPECGARMDGE